MSKRTDAIRKEIDKSKNSGRGKFSYVDLTALDKLGIDQFKPVVGDNFMRVIPPKSDDIFWSFKIRIHTKVGADGGTFLCLQDMFGEPCSICERREKMKQRDADPEAVKKLYSSTRRLMFVVNTKNKDTEKLGPLWFDCPETIHKELLALSENRRTGVLQDISDPDAGKDIVFERSGAGLQTRYIGFTLEDSGTIPDSWLDIPEFEDILALPTYEQVNEADMGSIDDSEDLDTSNARTSRSRSREVEPKDEVENEPVVEKEDDTNRRTNRRSRVTEEKETSSNDQEPSAEKEEARSGSVRSRIEEIKARRRA